MVLVMRVHENEHVHSELSVCACVLMSVHVKVQSAGMGCGFRDRPGSLHSLSICIVGSPLQPAGLPKSRPRDAHTPIYPQRHFCMTSDDPLLLWTPKWRHKHHFLSSTSTSSTQLRKVLGDKNGDIYRAYTPRVMCLTFHTSLLCVCVCVHKRARTCALRTESRSSYM